MDRRTHLKRLLAIPAAFATLPPLQGCTPNSPVPPSASKVVRIHNPAASDGLGLDDENLRDEVIQAMIDDGIRTFTGRETTNEAWTEIIPLAQARVALKVNCQITEICTKGTIVRAVIAGLINRGVDASNIVVYDLRDNAFEIAGLEKNLGAGPKVGTIEELGGFSTSERFGSVFRRPRIKFGNVVAGQGPFGCDFIINIPVLKALDGWCGVSLSMKNHFGSVSAPWAMHRDIQNSVAALNAHPLIRRKTRLILVDGIFAGLKWPGGRDHIAGPSPTRDQSNVVVTNQLLVGIDPVAIDSVGWSTIDRLRGAEGFPPVAPPPLYLQIAETEFGLGNSDPGRIDIVEI